MIDAIKDILSHFFVIPLVFTLGVYFTYQLRFIQITKLPYALKCFISERDHTGKSSSFSAVAAVLGGNLGTGNIAGIAVALKTGGPGALFWMWIMALLGATLKFTGCTLGVLYRQKQADGRYVGGPMYYLEKGLNLKFFAKLFSIATVGGALTVGCWVQMHSIALPIAKTGFNPMIAGLLMSLLVGIVIFGGLKRFNKVVSIIVPIMGLGYITACLIILSIYNENIIPSLSLILQSALNPQTVVSGVVGFTILEAIRVGFDRGLFATDVGVGLAPIIHSTIESPLNVKELALKQGLISTIPPLVVMVVCMLTGLVLMVTDAWLIPNLESTNLCIEAFKAGLGRYAGLAVTATLTIFAYTTILTWSLCADRSIEYLFSKKWVRLFQIGFIAVIPLGTLFTVNLVWTLADIFMNCMLIINIIGLVGLSHLVFKKVQKAKKKIFNSHLAMQTKSDRGAFLS